jgi:hypothetical protein
MFDLNKLIVEAYEEEKSKDFSFDRLVEMVENVMAMQESLGLGGIIKEEQINQVLQNAQKQAESELPAEWHKLLPKIEISERWGIADPTGDNEARQQFETYMSAIGGSTVKEKLTNIATFVNNKTQDTDTRKILSNIIFLDLLSTVVNNFSPSGSGFLGIKSQQLLGKTEEAKQKFAAAASDINALQAYKTAIEGLGIKIPSEVAFDDTLFTDKTDEQINNIYLARRAFTAEIKKYLNRKTVGDDKKAAYLPLG